MNNQKKLMLLVVLAAFCSASFGYKRADIEKFILTGSCPGGDFRNVTSCDLLTICKEIKWSRWLYWTIFGIDFNNADLQKADFSYANLKKVLFNNTNLRWITATRANFEGSSFKFVNFGGADLRGVNFRSTWIADTKFEYVDLWVGTFTDARLVRVQFNNAYIGKKCFGTLNCDDESLKKAIIEKEAEEKSSRARFLEMKKDLKKNDGQATAS